MSLTLAFNSWFEYHEWLKENCEKYSVFSIKDNDGKVYIEYIDRTEWLNKSCGKQ